MSNYSNAVLSLTPVAYYRLNQASGTVAADASGNSHAGTLAGVAAYSVPGALPSDADTALGFTASGGLNLPGLRLDTWTGYTLVFWGLVSSRWQMVAYTCDSNGGERLYLNGSPYLGGAGDVFVVAADLSAAGFVGGGDLDEVALYQSVLSPAQVAMLWLAAGYSAPTPKFFITAKNKLTNLAVAAGIERKMASFSCIPRFNALGSWALTLQDTVQNPSPLASVFMRDGSGNLHNGIYVALDNEDGNGPQYVISGPQTDVDVKVDASGLRTITASGSDEKYWLKKRRALQVPDYPYAGYIGAYFAGGSGAPPYHYIAPFPLRYYQLNEPSGTTASDTMLSGHNATYTGGFILAQPGLIDDPTSCILLNGSTGYLSVPTAGLPTGNATWAMAAWGYLSSYPAAGAIVFALGTSGVSKQNFLLEVNASGFPAMRGSGLTTATGTTQVSQNTPHFFMVVYDGTTIRGYLDGTQFGAIATGGLSITYGACTFGMYVDGTSEPWPGSLAHAAVYSNISGASDIATMYAVGTSRQAYLAYDTRPTPVAPGLASTAIWQYVDVNAGASALPAATFTNWQRTTPARQVPNLTLAADPLLGSSIKGLARMDSLLDLIGACALQSSPELGFTLEQIGTDLLFTIFEPTDKTLTAVFSLDRKNLAQGYEWTYSAAQGNYIFAGGSNPTGGSVALTDRLFGENGDATSQSQFGLLEDFLDARAATDGPTIQQQITGQLVQDAKQLTVNGTIVNTPALYYKGPGDFGWDLGDKVTVLADGQVFQEVIREVQIDLQPGQPALITAAIGTPVDTSIIQEQQVQQQRLQALQQSSTNLGTNY